MSPEEALLERLAAQLVRMFMAGQLTYRYREARSRWDATERARRLQEIRR